MPVIPDPVSLAEELARAMIADILELWSLEEISPLIEEMEAELRTLN
jgi:hypothetical protein